MGVLEGPLEEVMAFEVGLGGFSPLISSFLLPPLPPGTEWAVRGLP